MTIKNQVDHRADYAKQKAAGQIPDVTAGRHGRNKPRLVARLARARQRSVQRPLAAEGKSLADQLGIPVPEAVRREVTRAAKPEETLEILAPSPIANVPATTAPEVHIEPPMGGGELPPIAGMTPAPPLDPRLRAGSALQRLQRVEETSAEPGRWSEKTPAEPAEADRPADEVVTEEESGETPLV